MRSAIARTALAALILAACQDVTAPSSTDTPPPPTTPSGPTMPPPDSPPLASVACTATRARVECSAPASIGEGARAAVYGGQRRFVLLASSSVSYDSAAQAFAFDMTVTNLLPERIGHDGRGGSDSGVSVFLASGPVVTAGTGTAEPGNPDGWGTFTQAGQAFWHFPESIGPGQTSEPRRVVLTMPPTVEAFAFSLLVSAERVPALVAVYGQSIIRLGIDGRDRVTLAEGGGTYASPSVGGGWAYFQFTAGISRPEIRRVRLIEGGTPERIVIQSSHAWYSPTQSVVSRPAISRDGKALLFNHAYDVDKFQVRAWIANAEGKGAHPLSYPKGGGTASDYWERYPRWIGDAGRISFLKADSGIVEADSTTWGEHYHAMIVRGLRGLELGSDGFLDLARFAWDSRGERIAFYGALTLPKEQYLSHQICGGMGGVREFGLYVKDSRSAAPRRLWPLRLTPVYPQEWCSRPEVERVTEAGRTDVAWTADGRLVIHASSADSYVSGLYWLDPDHPEALNLIPGTAHGLHWWNGRPQYLEFVGIPSPWRF